MTHKIDFNIAIGSWKATSDREIVRIEYFNQGSNPELPAAIITQLVDKEGNESDKIIGSTNDPFINGNTMRIHPYSLSIIDQNTIVLNNIKAEFINDKVYKKCN